MKKLSLALAIAVALIAGQAHAAKKIEMIAPNNTNKSTMTNTINETTVKDSTIVTAGKNAETNVGVIDNKGGTMTNTVNETTVKNSTVVTAGEGAKTNIGRISNQ